MSDACPHPREGGKPARGGPGWEHTAGSLPRRGICRVRPLRKGWVVGHHMACHWGGGTNPSPFPPYPKMRKYALPALPRLPLGGGRPFLCVPRSRGKEMSGETRPQIPARTLTPQHHPPLVPCWEHAQEGDISMITLPWDPPPCSPPRAVPCQGTLLSPAPVPGPCAIPCPRQLSLPGGRVATICPC